MGILHQFIAPSKLPKTLLTVPIGRLCKSTTQMLSRKASTSESVSSIPLGMVGSFVQVMGEGALSKKRDSTLPLKLFPCTPPSSI